jgi:hypothetical protein
MSPPNLFQEHPTFNFVLMGAWAFTLVCTMGPSSQRRSFAFVIPCLQTLAVCRIVYVLQKSGYFQLHEPSAMTDATVTTLPYAVMLAGHALLSEGYVTSLIERRPIVRWRDLDARAIQKSHRRMGRLSVCARRTIRAHRTPMHVARATTHSAVESAVPQIHR